MTWGWGRDFDFGVGGAEGILVLALTGKRPSVTLCCKAAPFEPAQKSSATLSFYNRSQGLLFSEAKKPHAEAVGQTGAQGLVRGCGPHCPPVSRKNFGFLTFVLVPQPTFGQQAQTKLPGLREVSCWEGA